MSGVLMTIVVAALLAVNLSATASQPPTPGGRKGESRPPQQTPNTAQQQPATYPRGTEQSPVIVQIQPSPKTDAETAKEQNKEDDESSAKWWTQALTVFTGIVSLLQLVLIGLQARIMHVQNKIMTKQTDIMNRQERAAATSVTLAKAALELTDKQAILLDQQRRISRHSLRASQLVQRAWLSLHDLSLELRKEANPVVALLIKNSGQTPAFIVSVRVMLDIRPAHEPLPQPPSYGPEMGSTAPAVLVSGEQSSARTVMPQAVDELGYDSVMSGEASLYIYGYFEYRDVHSKKRTRKYGFARQYDARLSAAHQKSMFTYSKAEGYNYAT